MTAPLRVRQIVLDSDRIRPLAEFYRELLGWTYRPEDEPPPAGEPDPNGDDWLVLRNPDGIGLSFQRTDDYRPPTWPGGSDLQQVHLDMSVPDTDSLVAQRDRVLDLGGTLLYDRFDDPQEPLYVFADPSGHPFCIFVA